MALNQLSSANSGNMFVDAGTFLQNVRITTPNQVLYYTEPSTGIVIGYQWNGTLPHVTSTASPISDGGISTTAWQPIIYTGLKEKLSSEGITLNWQGHLPSIEVAYGLPNHSLAIWIQGLVSTGSNYWLYSDGTVWSGVGTLGASPTSPFIKLQPSNNSSLNFFSTLATDGQTVITVPYAFTSCTLYIGGLLQDPAQGAYTVSGNVITVAEPLTLNDDIFVFVGSSLQIVNNDTIRTFGILATDGQTAVLIPYNFSTISVYVNGTLQNPLNGAYSILGTTITFSEPLTLNDEVFCYVRNPDLGTTPYILESNLAQNTGYGLIGQVDSIATLRAIEPTLISQKIMVSGYYVGSNIGGGEFYYDPSDTTSVDNGGTIIVSAGGKRWKRSKTSEMNVLLFGADPSGILDCSSAFINSALNNVSFIPAGTYRHETATVSMDGFYFYGENINDTIITSSTNITMFNITGLGGGLSDMFLQYTTSHTNPHVTTTGSNKIFERIHVLGYGDRASQGQGMILGSTSVQPSEICIFNNNIIEHCSVSSFMSEFKSNQCFFWPESKQFGLQLNGSYCPNNVIFGADLLPPFYSTYDSTGNLAVACLWVTGAVLQPRIVDCYIDGNPSYTTGVGILIENGVLQPSIEGGIANKCSSTSLIFDSVIQPFCSMKFYNNNRQGNGSHDILIRNTYSQAVEAPVIRTTHIQSAVLTGTLGAAISIDSTITSTPGWILEPNIQQPGTGSGYIANEINLATVSDPTLIKMAYAQGVRRSGIAYGSVTAAIGATSATINLGPLALYYIPNAGQINITISSGNIVNVLINSITANSIFIIFPSLTAATIFNARVILI